MYISIDPCIIQITKQVPEKFFNCRFHFPLFKVVLALKKKMNTNSKTKLFFSCNTHKLKILNTNPEVLK